MFLPNIIYSLAPTTIFFLELYNKIFDLYVTRYTNILLPSVILHAEEHYVIIIYNSLFNLKRNQTNGKVKEKKTPTDVSIIITCTL